MEKIEQRWELGSLVDGVGVKGCVIEKVTLEQRSETNESWGYVVESLLLTERIAVVP